MLDLTLFTYVQQIKNLIKQATDNGVPILAIYYANNEVQRTVVTPMMEQAIKEQAQKVAKNVEGEAVGDPVTKAVE